MKTTKQESERYRLYDLKGHEVSLVDRGAVGVEFLIIKNERKGGKTMLTNEQLKAIDKVLKAELSEDVAAKIAEAIAKAELDEDGKNAVMGAMRLLAPYSEQLGGEVLAALAAAAGIEMLEAKAEGEDMTDEEKAKKLEDEEKAKAEAAAAAPFNKAYAEVKKAALEAAGDKSEAVAEVFKAAEHTPVEVAIQKDADDPKYAAILKRAEDTEAKLEKERSLRIKKEFEEKAGEYKHIAKKEDDLSNVLREASEKLDEQTFKKLETILKAADAQLTESQLLKEAGSDKIVTTTVEGKVAKLAAKKMESNPNLTKAQAIAKVYDEDATLYEAYEKESKERNV